MPTLSTNEGERYANKGVRSTAYQKALILEGQWYQKDLRVISGRTVALEGLRVRLLDPLCLLGFFGPGRTVVGLL